ncbi:unnamed protein product [Brassica oleracea]
MRGPRPEDFETNPSTPITGQPTPTYPAGARKKGVGVRTWLVLCARGQAQTTEVGKHAIMRRTGLPARDLRILDPLLSYPSTVLGRERAIVINLEHIKAIITAQEVLLLNSKDPSVAPFIDELQRRILCHYRATKPKEEENYEGETRMSMDQAQGGGDGTPLLFGEQGDEAKKDAKQSLENQDGSKVLPFEFVALEACLEAASSSLESEAVRLELEAHPALDKLTSKISTLNLERVRQIKSRLVAITGRVQKVRDELEHLLDDDEDMAEMYLTEKLAQKLENSSASSMNESDTVEVDLPEGDEDDRHAPDFLNLLPSTSNRDESYLRANDDAHDLLMSTHSALSRNSRGTHTSSTRSAMTNKFDVEELEMLLEAYFVQIDGTLNKLSTLREYVDDTEDYINIMLDDKQNHLLQMGVMLTTATLVMSAFIAVAGVFGMNITIELFKDEKAGPTRFAWTVIGGFIGSIFLYVGAIGNMSSRRESRDSDSKRDRSRFDRESSPKRSRRDGKPEEEGVRSKKGLDVSTETDKKPRQSLRDAAPLEPDAQGLRKDFEKKHSETTKQAPHLSEELPSRPYHQHDDRRTNGRDDRRQTSERGSWRGSRDQSNRRAGDDRRDQDKSTWRHDRFHESDDTKGGALSRKRPAFREKKIPEESRIDSGRTRTEEAKDTNLNSRRQNERNWRSNNERPATGRDRVWNRDDGTRQSYRTDREGFNRNGRSGLNGSWAKAEKKWDHDLYEEANKSPARANEEEQIAKVEALLSSS